MGDFAVAIFGNMIYHTGLNFLVFCLFFGPEFESQLMLSS